MTAPKIDPKKMYVCMGYSDAENTLRGGTVLNGSDPRVRSRPECWFEADVPLDELYAAVRGRYPDLDLPLYLMKGMVGK